MKAPRLFASALLALAALLPLHDAGAADWPARPVKVVAGFPAGGATDILARAVGAELSKALGQPVVVENRPGAGGAIAADAVAQAPADGHTLLLCAITNQAIANNVFTRKPVDMVKDFAPVALVGNIPHVLVVNAQLAGATDLPGFLRRLKAEDGALNYGSQGNGTLSHLESELLLRKAGAKAVHVPYKGSAAALPDLIAGSTSFMFDSIPASLPHIRSGKLRALAVASSDRTAALPSTPTVVQAGLSGYEVNNWFGLLAPAGTPAHVVAALDRALPRVLAQPDLRERMVAQGVDLVHAGPRDTGLLMAKEMLKWGKIARDLAIRAD